MFRVLTLSVVDIEAGDAKALIAEKEGEGKADIAHADDTDAGFAGFDLLLQVGQRNVSQWSSCGDYKGFSVYGLENLGKESNTIVIPAKYERIRLQRRRTWRSIW